MPLRTWSVRQTTLVGLVSVALSLAACNSDTPAGSPSPSSGPAGNAASHAPGGSPSFAVTPSAGPPSAPTPTDRATPATSFVAALSSATLSSPLSRSVAFAVNGKILLAGGFTGSGTTGALQLLDPAGGSVTTVGKLKHALHDAAGGMIGDRLLVIGGGDQVAGVWVQGVATDGTASVVGALPRARADLGAAVVGDQLIVVGGGASGNVDRQVLATTDGVTFRVIATLLQGVRYPGVAAMDGKLYVIGGQVGAGDTAQVQIVDVANGTLSVGTPLAGPISEATAFVVGGAILVMGGRHGRKASSLIQRIDPSSGSVTTVGQLPYKVSDATGVVVDGTGYLIGGESKNVLDTIITVSPSP